MKMDDAFACKKVGAGGAAGMVKIGFEFLPVVVPAGFVHFNRKTYGIPILFRHTR